MKCLRCQLHDLPSLVQPLNLAESVWQSQRRLKRMLQRRITYLGYHCRTFFNTIFSTTTRETESPVFVPYLPGDMVMVKTRQEITKTLDAWNQLKGCSFMEEMWSLCGSRQTVLKRVTVFLDERDYKIKKCHGVVILRDVMCQGTTDFGRCDRSCFYFWKEEWLKKLSDDGVVT